MYVCPIKCMNAYACSYIVCNCLNEYDKTLFKLYITVSFTLLFLYNVDLIMNFAFSFFSLYQKLFILISMTKVQYICENKLNISGHCVPWIVPTTRSEILVLAFKKTTVHICIMFLFTSVSYYLITQLNCKLIVMLISGDCLSDKIAS